MLMYIVMIILSFATNKPLMDVVASCVKDTAVLSLDLSFTEHIVNLWNTFAPDIFNSFSSFKRSFKLADFSGFLKCLTIMYFSFLCCPAWFV